MKILYWVYHDLKVCSTCFRLCGIGVNPWGYEERLYWQSCSCDDKAEPPDNVTETQVICGKELVELCYCCGTALVPGGRPWFLFFCDECKQLEVRIDGTVVLNGKERKLFAGYNALRW